MTSEIIMRQRNEHDDRLKTVAKLSLFAELSPESLSLLAERLVSKHFESGQMVFLEGEPCKGLYIVESGLVKIYKVSQSGREQVLGAYGPGQALSELSIVDGGSHPFCAAALRRSTVGFIDLQNLHDLCRSEPECAQSVLNIVAARLRSALGMIEELSFGSVRTRLATYLLRTVVADRSSRKSVAQLPPNHEIAAQIGTVRELVSRHLGQFQAKGIIRITGRTIRILKVDALTAFSGRAELLDESLGPKQHALDCSDRYATVSPKQSCCIGEASSRIERGAPL